MKVTVCEFAESPNENEALWDALVDHVQAERSELVLLPEMPFHHWLAATKQVDQYSWEGAVAAHEIHLRHAVAQQAHKAELPGQRDQGAADR